MKGYCWHEGAENREMRRITAGDEAWAGEVAAFIASDEWVDMERVFKAGWITGEGTSLKAIAPLAGHVWEVDDPGGGLSMVQFADAIDDVPGREDARSWLATYNRGDVAATAEIREWLDRSEPPIVR